MYLSVITFRIIDSHGFHFFGISQAAVDFVSISADAGAATAVIIAVVGFILIVITINAIVI